MKRGDIFLAVVPGDFGKPRPVVIVQNDLANDIHDTIVVCPLSSYVVDTCLHRLDLSPSPENGLLSMSQIMIDKIAALRRDRLKRRIGSISRDQVLQLNSSIAFWLGI